MHADEHDRRSTDLDAVEYNGSIYKRVGGKWVDKNYMVVPDILQHNLNTQYSRQLDYDNMSVERLIQLGADFKETQSLALAERCFRKAAEKATVSQIGRILPSLTSIYRQIGKPQSAIDLLTYASKKHGGSVISAALMTSAAAAYCDLKQYKLAKKACDRAFAIGGGKASGELTAVYGRIRKEAPNEIEPIY